MHFCRCLSRAASRSCQTQRRSDKPPRIVYMKAAWRKMQGRRCISLSGWFSLTGNQTIRQICTCGGQRYVSVHKESVSSTPGMSVRVCTAWKAVYNMISSNSAWLGRQTLLSDMFTTATRSAKLHRQTSQWDYKITNSQDMCSPAIISLKLLLNCVPLLTYYYMIRSITAFKVRKKRELCFICHHLREESGLIMEENKQSTFHHLQTVMTVVNHFYVHNQHLLINISLGERFHVGWLTQSCKSALQ